MSFSIFLRKIYIILIFKLIFFSGSSMAGADIRVSDVSALSDNSDVSYVASISSCGQLNSIEAGSASELVTYTNDDVTLNPDFPSQCLLQFSLSGAARLSPTVKLTYQDGTIENFSESFVYEDVAPQISFSKVSILGESDQQKLVVEVEASDNQDIAYVSFSVVGLNASYLRSVGGVVAEAKEKSFVDDTQRVYPNNNSQSVFQLTIPLKNSLSNEQIAFDTIVLSDITVVDASGNHTSISKLSFTGDSIEESANALVVSNSKIVINNALQTPVIIPAVEFQFRGLVNLPGAGNGITYVSSHPDLVNVTSSGVLYALQETEAEEVIITVSYDGLGSVDVPVEADFSKTMVGISLAGVDANNPFVLSSLNTFYDLPEMVGVFDDGSTTVISGHWSPVIVLNSSMSAYIEKNNNNQIKSSVVISESKIYGLHLSLAELPGVVADISVIAIDEAPTVSLSVPNNIVYDTNLLLSAAVNDDVGISQVEFFSIVL